MNRTDQNTKFICSVYTCVFSQATNRLVQCLAWSADRSGT